MGLFDWLFGKRRIPGTTAGGSAAPSAAKVGQVLPKCVSGIIVFGPAPDKPDIVTKLASSCRGWTILLADNATQLMGMSIMREAGRSFQPCKVMFCHSIPSREKQPCTEQEFAVWQRQVLNATVQFLSAEDRPLFNAVDCEWIGAKDTSSMSPIFTWNELNAETCLRFIVVIERAYEKAKVMAGT